MPTYRVELDGKTYKVEAANEADLNDALSQLHGETPAPAAPTRDQSQPEMGRLERFARGIGRPFMGLGQLLANVGLNAMDEAGAGIDPREQAQAMNSAIAKEQVDYAARKPEGFDFAGLAGEMVGTAPLAMMGPGATLGQMAVRGGIQGAANGAVTPVADQSRPYWDQKREQVGYGTAGGAIAAPIVGSIARAFKPTISDEVSYLVNRDVRLSPGMIGGGAINAAEEKGTSIPVIGDMISGTRRQAIEDVNREAYKQVLEPLGKQVSADVGAPAIAQVKKAVSDAYNELLPNLRFVADDQFVAAQNNLKALVNELPEKSSINTFNSIWDTQVTKRLAPNGTMDGQTFKLVESKLSKLANDYSRSGGTNAELGSALKEGLNILRSGLDRSNPDYAGQLQAINKAFVGRKILASAAKASMKNDGVFTPSQLLRASARYAPSQFESMNAPLQQLGRAAESVVGSKYPDSGTAGRVAQTAFAGGAGYLAYAHPLVAAGGAALALPYTQFGRSVAQNLLAGSRGPLATKVGNLLSASAVPVGSAAAFAVTP